jgi:hypothetical protein
MPLRHSVVPRCLGALLLFAALVPALWTGRAAAATSASCTGGGFALVRTDQTSITRGDQKGSLPAARFGPSFVVKGRYVEFTVDAATFGVRKWTLTGAANAFDLTGGRPTEVFASKVPDHRGLALTGDLTLELKGPDLVLQRSGPGLSMKIQAKDCATGGIFQVEPARSDGTATVFTHVLAPGAFYFDNPNVRDRLGENIPCSGILPDGTAVACQGANADGTVTVTARVNFANDLSSRFVGRDSPQAAARIATDCANRIPNPFHPGTVSHCGGVSQWKVESGGRMGQVMGEDSTEIAPAAKVCTANCTAQNRVRGRAVVVGFPFPVPDAVRLKPRFFPGFVAP